jgi:hypothetical protein
MFTQVYFPKNYFVGYYFPPQPNALAPVDEIHIVGFLVNMGTMMNRY